MEVSSQIHAPAALPPSRQPIGTHWMGGWGGPQSRSGRGGEKHSQPLPGLEPSNIQPVAQRYTTEL
jgi:hypothetical protein